MGRTAPTNDKWGLGAGRPSWVGLPSRVPAVFCMWAGVGCKLPVPADGSPFMCNLLLERRRCMPSRCPATRPVSATSACTSRQAQGQHTTPTQHTCPACTLAHRI